MVYIISLIRVIRGHQFLAALVVIRGMLLVELVVRQSEELTHHLLLVADGDVALRPDAGQLKRALVTELAGGQLFALGVLRDVI